MGPLQNFHWIRPAVLLLLPMAGGLWWFWKKSDDPLRGWRNQIDAELLDAMTVKTARGRDRSPFLLLVAWVVAIVAIAGPTWKQEPNPFAADAAPLIVLLKADNSMEGTDPAPSAIERARLKIADLAKLRTGQPLGLVAYAGSAHLVLPPTRDTNAVAEMAAEISPDIMPKTGDRLDLAIRKACQILTDENNGGTLLVIADSVGGETQAIVEAHQQSGAFPIQFLALRDDESLRKGAASLRASVEVLTADESDLTAISKAAERSAVVGVAGDSRQWQESGYWLVPLVAGIVAFSFRREKNFDSKEAP